MTSFGQAIGRQAQFMMFFWIYARDPCYIFTRCHRYWDILAIKRLPPDCKSVVGAVQLEMKRATNDERAECDCKGWTSQTAGSGSFGCRDRKKNIASTISAAAGPSLAGGGRVEGVRNGFQANFDPPRVEVLHTIYEVLLDSICLRDFEYVH